MAAASVAKEWKRVGMVEEQWCVYVEHPASKLSEANDPRSCRSCGLITDDQLPIMLVARVSSRPTLIRGQQADESQEMLNVQNHGQGPTKTTTPPTPGSSP